MYVLPDCYPPPFWSDLPPAVSWQRPAAQAGFSLSASPPAGQSAPWSQPPISQCAPATLQWQRSLSKHSTLYSLLYILWYDHCSHFLKLKSEALCLNIWQPLSLCSPILWPDSELLSCWVWSKVACRLSFLLFVVLSSSLTSSNLLCNACSLSKWLAWQQNWSTCLSYSRGQQRLPLTAFIRNAWGLFPISIRYP